MPRKKNTRAAQGAGNIRKKTVMRNGKEYTFWEARVTVGRDPGTGKQLRRSFSGKTQKEVREKMQAAAADVPAARIHDLRHSYAVAALRSGDDIKTVQENLGHQTAAFTLDVYAHVTSGMKRESANRMDQYIHSVTKA